jgi:hypothetical protein
MDTTTQPNTDAQFAAFLSNGVFTKITTLWANTAISPDIDLDTGAIESQQTEHEIQQYGNWVIGITYTSPTDPITPQRVLVSMWTTKDGDHNSHEVMVSKMMGVIRSHYGLDDSIQIMRLDSIAPGALLWEPETNIEEIA